jgi:hypothetical protein
MLKLQSEVQFTSVSFTSEPKLKLCRLGDCGKYPAHRRTRGTAKWRNKEFVTELVAYVSFLFTCSVK